MKNLPLVSVVIPCYNHEKYVEECILSVVNQSYKNIQLIVIDDGSKDRSVEIIERLQAKYQFVFEAQNNIGLSSTLNKAITKYSKGKYISIVASDDFWHIDKIKHQVAYYEQNPHYGLIFSNAYLVNSDSEVLGAFDEHRFKHECTFEDLILDKSGIPALTAMVKKEVYLEVGLFDETLIIEDWDMWLRITDVYKVGYLKMNTAYYRTHDTNISSKTELMMDDRLKIIKKWRRKYSSLCQQAIKYWKTQALVAFAKKNKKVAVKYVSYNLDYLFTRTYRKYLFKYIFSGRFK